jgi:hypothetical protein
LGSSFTNPKSRTNQINAKKQPAITPALPPKKQKTVPPSIRSNKKSIRNPLTLKLLKLNSFVSISINLK